MLAATKPAITRRVLSPDQKWQAFSFWQLREATLEHDNLVSANALGALRLYTNPNNIGFNDGNIRPGRDGQFDLYYRTSEFLTPQERLLICDLTAQEVEDAERACSS